MTSEEEIGKIITFYSYKGGTGRSMALANTACILAEQQTTKRGNGVLMIDWDLEAPGLHRYFDSWITTEKLGIDVLGSGGSLESAPGLIELFYELEKRVDNYIKGHELSSLTEDEVHSIVDQIDFSSFIISTEISDLSLLKAGRFDPRNPKKYSELISAFRWEDLFNKAPHVFRVFSDALARKYSYVLIDSRTGISDTSGITTMLMPEILVVVFTPNLQSLRGGLELISRAADYRKDSSDLRRFTVFPLVSRIEASEEQLKKEWRFGTFQSKGYQREFEEVLSGIYGEQLRLDKYFDEVQIQHYPRYSYGEQIAVLIDESDRLSLSRSYESFANKLTSQESPWEVVPEGAIDSPPPATSQTDTRSSWDDPDLERRLVEALNTFDWQKAEDICDEIIERIKSTANPISESFAKKVLFSLRRKRQFRLIAKLADVILQSGVRALQVRRQYVQALIDQGLLSSAEGLLQGIIQDAQHNRTEELEARGLMGRIYKQMYVNNNDPLSPSNRANLQRALDEYLSVYQLNPKENLWHGINVVAIAARAKRDGLLLTDLPDSTQLAQEILSAIQTKEDSADLVYFWDQATRVEALLATSEIESAALAAWRYADDPNVDSFEIASTLRQLQEVWQLKDVEHPGNLLLPILRIGYLRQTGSLATVEPRALKAEADSLAANMHSFEAIFGEKETQLYKWYKKGLDQCNSIARIERRNGKGYGTGCLVRAEDFFPNERGVLLLTNSQVVSESPNSMALLPKHSQANFSTMSEIVEVEDVFWSSPYNELDSTLLRLKTEPKAPPLTLHAEMVKMETPPPRMYTIGYSQGRDLELSLQDSYLVGCNDSFVHYRTPMEPGSSGSPLFERDDWRVVGIHHGGTEDLARLDGEAGTYEANEAISILALQAATRQR